VDHTATVGTWLLALEASTGVVVEVIPTGWDGSGGFYDSCLNFVAPLLHARGLRYQSWMELDGRQVAVMHQRTSWGPA
jgi:hypothetical protein